MSKLGMICIPVLPFCLQYLNFNVPPMLLWAHSQILCGRICFILDVLHIPNPDASGLKILMVGSVVSIGCTYSLRQVPDDIRN